MAWHIHCIYIHGRLKHQLVNTKIDHIWEKPTTTATVLSTFNDHDYLIKKKLKKKYNKNKARKKKILC